MPWDIDTFPGDLSGQQAVDLMQTEEASEYIRAVAAVYLNEVEDFETFKKRAANVMHFAQMAVDDAAYDNFPEEEFDIKDVWV